MNLEELFQQVERERAARKLERCLLDSFSPDDLGRHLPPGANVERSVHQGVLDLLKNNEAKLLGRESDVRETNDTNSGLRSLGGYRNELPKIRHEV